MQAVRFILALDSRRDGDEKRRAGSVRMPALLPHKEEKGVTVSYRIMPGKP
jgi:hypothetical protein